MVRNIDCKKQLDLIINSAEYSNIEQFRKDIKNWIEKFQIYALNSLDEYKDKIPTTLLNEILELVGIADLREFEDVRVDLLKNFLASENLEILYGAVEGISSLDTQIAIPILENALIQKNIEKKMVLKQTIVSYITQLKELQ